MIIKAMRTTISGENQTLFVHVCKNGKIFLNSVDKTDKEGAFDESLILYPDVVKQLRDILNSLFSNK